MNDICKVEIIKTKDWLRWLFLGNDIVKRFCDCLIWLAKKSANNNRAASVVEDKEVFDNTHKLTTRVWLINYTKFAVKVNISEYMIFVIISLNMLFNIY